MAREKNRIINFTHERIFIAKNPTLIVSR